MSATPEQQAEERRRLDPLRRELTRGISEILKEFYGKGPDLGRSYINDDTVLVLMHGGYTRVEDTLLQAGRGEEVIAQRTAFQEVIRPRFVAEVERVTGRKVIAFMSGSHQDPDFQAEIFVLDTLAAHLNHRRAPADPKKADG